MLPRTTVIRHISWCETILLSGYPPFCDRRRIDFRDLAKAVGFGRMRARDEGSADFGRVPAGLHAEAKRFFRHDMAWREVLHQVLSVLRRSIWSERLDEACGGCRPNIVLFRFLPRKAG